MDEWKRAVRTTGRSDGGAAACYVVSFLTTKETSFIENTHTLPYKNFPGCVIPPKFISKEASRVQFCLYPNGKATTYLETCSKIQSPLSVTFFCLYLMTQGSRSNPCPLPLVLCSSGSSMAPQPPIQQPVPAKRLLRRQCTSVRCTAGEQETKASPSRSWCPHLLEKSECASLRLGTAGGSFSGAPLRASVIQGCYFKVLYRGWGSKGPL